MHVNDLSGLRNYGKVEDGPPIGLLRMALSVVGR